MGITFLILAIIFTIMSIIDIYNKTNYEKSDIIESFILGLFLGAAILSNICKFYYETT